MHDITYFATVLKVALCFCQGTSCIQVKVDFVECVFTPKAFGNVCRNT